MKKTLSLILAFALVLSCTVCAFAGGDADSFGAYKRVFIIGIDGAGRFIKDVDTPNFDRIFADGAVDYTARAETKTDSGPNWGAILTGVSFLHTKLENGTASSVPRTSDGEYPSIFTYVRREMPEAELASFVHWNAVNYGIIENDIGVTEVNITNDSELTDAICAYFDEGNDPTLFYVQLDEVDAAGHSKGSESDEFFEAIKRADGYLGQIYDSAEKNGLLDDTLFVVAADHGHTRIGGHGGITMRETNVTVAFSGKTVAKGGKLDSGARNRDIAAASLYALGIERPGNMSARIPADLFTDVSGEPASFSKDPLDSFVAALAWIITSITGVFDFI
ncbi:MAG: alkaline phosphatase [Clostridia bacterium]|nr:alkaline phosphatase [Clostridia bacterium]